MYKTKRNESELIRAEREREREGEREKERERERSTAQSAQLTLSWQAKIYTVLVFCAVAADFWLDKRERIFVVTLLI